MTRLHPLWFPSLAWFRYYINHPGTAMTPLVGRNSPVSPNSTIIRGPNGLQKLSIPLPKGPREDLRDIKPQYSEKWARECRNSLKTAYGTSAFYRYYDYLIEPLFFKEYEHLFAMNIEALQLICACFRLPIPGEDFSAAGVSWEEQDVHDMNDYGQYFTERYPFSPQVGVLDVLFHCGPLGGLVLSGKAL